MTTLLPRAQAMLTTLALPAVIPTVNTVHHCRAEDLLTALPSDYVDLIVTSPPYDNLRTYNGFAWDFEYIARQSYRVLKPGGVLVWVVGDSVVDGSETLSCFDQALYFRRGARFNAWDTMIWRKIVPGNMGKRYNHAFEYMFVMTKGEPKTFNPIMKRNKRAGSVTGGGTRTKNGHVHKASVVNEFGLLENVWDIQGGPQGDEDHIPHPAKFPEKLANDHILTWSNPGDIVVDYFGGSGTTAKMARNNNRRWITCDISAEYCELMRKRLAQPFTVNMFEMGAA